MREIEIDIETYSDVDLSKCGVYRYAESPEFRILLFGYAVDGGTVNVVDIAQGEHIPAAILDALVDDGVLKWAYNANFERVCLSRYLRDIGRSLDPHNASQAESTDGTQYLSPNGWRCSMVWGAYLGLPMSLDMIGKVLNLDAQKMVEGKALIRFFCVPCKPTQANEGRARNLPASDPQKWATFKLYNKRDVEVEMAIRQRLAKYPVPDFVWDEYHIDQVINDRGIMLDMTLVKQAIAIDARSREELTARLQELTSLRNPNSTQQMRDWLGARGLNVNSLDKRAIKGLLASAPTEVAEVLELRQQLAMASVKKYQAMQNAACADGRARGMFQFYGAARTGRFAGRLIQLQNLPQNHMAYLEDARDLVRSGAYDMLVMMYDSVPTVLSELIRTAFVPREGHKFIVADFSAIEARVLSFIAGESWRIDVFANDGDIYCASASAMFHVPVQKHGANSHLRQKGKIAELALGYGGSVGALRAMGAIEMGLSEAELPSLVDAWRRSNPRIVALWWDVDRAVKDAIRQRTDTVTHGIRFQCRSGMLFIALPSGRRLCYAKPRIEPNRFGGESITYEGIGPTKKWERIESYGPKFVENIIQGIARDILMYAMQTLAGYEIVGHVHDEVIIECDKAVSVDEVCEMMAKTPPWIHGLKLRADGYEAQFYRKD